MALGHKTGGRQKGAPNRASAEARAAAEATGILPLNYMLAVMRDEKAEPKRRDAMAMAAAPYLHPKVSPVEAKSSESKTPNAEKSGIEVRFVWPSREHQQDDKIDARLASDGDGTLGRA